MNPARLPPFVSILSAVAAGLLPAEALARHPVRCPGPTELRQGRCVLTHDAVLDQPLAIAAGVHLDCRGKRLTPDPSEPPMVAVVIHDTGGARVTGCSITGFEHGIYVLRAGGAGAERNWIVGNDIAARVKGISLWGAVGTQVVGNRISVRSGFGEAIGLWRGSSDNVIRANLIKSLGGGPDEPAPADFPAGPFTYAPATAPPASAITVATGAAAQGIVQITLVGELFQFPAATTLGVRDNLVEDNLVYTSGVPAIGLKAKNLGTIVRGNVVVIDAHRPAPAITVGVGGKGSARAPSTCMLRPDRFCHVDGDCNPGLAGEPVDTCRPTECLEVDGACWYGSMVAVDFTSHEVVVEGNAISGAVTVGIDAGAAGMTIVGNIVTGATSAALAISNAAASDAWVEHNVFVGNEVGLDLMALSADAPFVFSHNDVVASLVRPIRAPTGASIVVELSHERRGNYWGRRCPAAFVPLPAGPRVCTGDASLSCLDDAACVGHGVCATADADAPDDLVVDSHPFGRPIAASGQGEPCR